MFNSLSSISTVPFLTFWLAKPVVLNSLSGTSMVPFLKFSLVIDDKAGSRKFAEPISPTTKFGFNWVCNIAFFIFDLNNISFFTLYEKSSFVLAGISVCKFFNNEVLKIDSADFKFLTISIWITLSLINCFLKLIKSL